MEEPAPALRAEVGRRLARRRRIMALTQSEVAAHLGVQRAYISQLENGHMQALNIDHIRALAAVLETSIDYLLCVTNEDPGVIPPRDGSGAKLAHACSSSLPTRAIE